MSPPRTHWTACYVACCMSAALPVGVFVAQVTGVAPMVTGQLPEQAWGFGAVGGALLGAALAWATRAASGVHRWLRRGGVGLAVAGGLAAVVLFIASEQRREPAIMFAGFGEFLLGVSAVIVALVGAALWAAGVCGRRRVAAVA